MVIQNNLPAANAKGYLNKNVSGVKKASEKLASGFRINRAADDAAGLGMSENLRSQIRGIRQSIRNTQDGINLVQTFEGALGETVHIIHRMGELAVEAANGTFDNDIDRTAVQLEFKNLKSEIDQIADTDFNGLCMLNGGRMADGFTYVSKHGTTWMSPSDLSFPENGLVSTFRHTEGFPDIEMNIEILPEAKDRIIYDKELARAFTGLNNISVRSYYNDGVPEFSLVGLDEGDENVYSIRTEDGVGIISITTSTGKTIDVAKVTCTELPHYASTSAVGRWDSSSAASGSYLQPDPNDPANSGFNLSKWKETYVDGDTATRAERQAYLDWIKATSARGTLTNDKVFDNDADKQVMTWNVDGKTYELPVDADGKPLSSSGVSVPVYPDTSHGPQIYYGNVHFYKDDEDFKPEGDIYVRLYWSTDYNMVSGSWNGRQVTAGDPSMSKEFYLNTWLDHGNESITLTYDKASGMWYDNLGGEGDKHPASYYGITDRYYSDTEYNRKYGYEARNLYHFYESDGKLPDGFKLSVSVTTPYYRSSSSSGMQFYPNMKNDDLTMDEYDPDNPAAGGVDYKVARDGATYTYDGTEQPDGTFGAWRDEEGNVVDLEAEGIYLPESFSSYSTLPFHDGMKITVSNPTMSGVDYIQARILAYDNDVNAYDRVYDNITYSEDLILQVNSRSKDAMEFTFSYNSSGLGDLQSDLNCTAKGLGITDLSLNTQEEANRAIDQLGYALNKVSMIRSSFGAIENRLNNKINYLENAADNTTASESQIRDADMASEMMNYTKNSVLQQAAQTMLAQTSHQPEGILQLLG